MKFAFAICSLLGVSFIAGCGKDDKSPEDTATTDPAAAISSGGQPVDGEGGDSSNLPTVCASDQKLDEDEEVCKLLPLAEMTSRGDCAKNFGFWYDQKDVLVTSEAGYLALKASCHASRKDACPATGVIPLGTPEWANTPETVDVQGQNHYVSSVPTVYSTFRCLAGADLTLSLNNGKFKEIDVGLNPDIVSLYIGGNADLAKIYVTPANSKLENLDLSSSKVPTGDFVGISSLRYLSLNHASGITSLDVSKLTKLQILDVEFTSLTSLDLSHNDLIIGLGIGGTTIPIASLNLTRYGSQFLYFSATDRQLTSLAGVPIAGLSYLYLDGAIMPTIDLSGMPNLSYFSCSRCSATSIDLSNSPGLYLLDLSGNQLSSIDLTMLPLLESLNLSGNQFTALNVTGNIQLSDLDLSHNNLTYNGTSTVWDMNTLSKIRDFYVAGNPNFVMTFETGVKTHANLLDPTKYVNIHVEQARWAAFNGPNKPMWTFYGTDPDGYYTAP